MKSLGDILRNKGHPTLQVQICWLGARRSECFHHISSQPVICWWYLVVTQKILVVVIGHFHATAKLRRLCGRDSSFCGGYAATKAYSRSNRLHKNAIWVSAHERACVIFSGVKEDPLGSPQKNLAHSAPPWNAIKSTFCLFLAFF